jgi:hypothetical protein
MDWPALFEVSGSTFIKLPEEKLSDDVEGRSVGEVI